MLDTGREPQPLCLGVRTAALRRLRAWLTALSMLRAQLVNLSRNKATPIAASETTNEQTRNTISRSASLLRRELTEVERDRLMASMQAIVAPQMSAMDSTTMTSVWALHRCAHGEMCCCAGKPTHVSYARSWPTRK